MKKTRAKRKLVKKPTLQEITQKYIVGVPVSKLIRQFELDISSPCLIKLIKINLTLDARSGRANLYPVWLDNSEEAPHIQTNPDTWSFEGRFPKGRWIAVEN